MAHSLPPLQWLRSFECAARHNSFSAAARELHLTPSAISYQVKNLEEYFRTPLFERLPRGLILTERGRAYLPSVVKAFSDLSASSVGMFGSPGKSSISIRAAFSFGNLWLAPRLGDFLHQYPDIDVNLHSSLWIDHAGQHECDLEIRYGAGNWNGFHSEILIREKIELVCSPERRSQLGDIADLLDQPLIHIMGVEDSWDRLFGREGLKIPKDKRQIKVDTSLMALELAASGAGYALLFKSFAQEYLDSGKLVVPLDVALETEQANHLVYPLDKSQLRPEVQLFKNWLFAQISKES